MLLRIGLISMVGSTRRRYFRKAGEYTRVDMRVAAGNRGDWAKITVRRCPLP